MYKERRRRSYGFESAIPFRDFKLNHGSPLFAMNSPVESIGRYKVVVVGDQTCGKTSLLNAFVRNSAQTETPFIFEGGVSTLRFDTKEVDFMMWDLSGCVEYDGLRCELYQDTDIFLICFDIGNHKTLKNVTENWIPELSLEGPNTPYILVGCKNDLRTDKCILNDKCLLMNPDKNNCEENTSVTKEKGEKVAQDWGAREYIECCAKTGYNVKEVFRTAAQVLISPNEEKNNNNLSTLKLGFSKFTKRKSAAELGELNYLHHYRHCIRTNKKGNFRRASAD